MIHFFHFYFSGLWFFAEMYSCKKLYDKCHRIIRKRFVSVTTLSDEFLELGEKALMELLKIKGLSLGKLLVHVLFVKCYHFTCISDIYTKLAPLFASCILGHLVLGWPTQYR